MAEKRKRSARWHLHLHPSIQILGSGPQHAFSRSPRAIHPTHVQLSRVSPDDEPGKPLEATWTSRDHRKNRHWVVPPGGQQQRIRSSRGRSIWSKLGNLRHLEYWNISWWVAMAFTLGSVVWVVNGFAVFLPLCNPRVPTLETTAGWTAWLGATIFEAGSILGILEAWNRDDAVNFGWAVRRLGGYAPVSNDAGDVEDSLPSDEQREKFRDGLSFTPKKKKWIWFTTDTKYWYELGFLAAFTQLCGATIFWISGFTALPSILEVLERNKPLLDGVFWAPQVVGGSGFIISAIIIMLETQKKWYLPSLTSLGWHVGFWNFIGAIGFMLCGALGFAISEANSKIEYQSSLSTFWGGWAFLLASVLQWYESVNGV